jgi:hypothetical protein
MAEPRKSKAASADVGQMMDEILTALSHIRQHMPNGELKIIQEKVEGIEAIQEKLSDDVSQIKKLLLDPETGVIVRVNKNTQFREENEKLLRDKYETLNEIYKWKDGVNRALWVIFTALAALMLEMFWKK